MSALVTDERCDLWSHLNALVCLLLTMLYMVSVGKGLDLRSFYSCDHSEYSFQHFNALKFVEIAMFRRDGSIAFVFQVEELAKC
jgi:hypothetical protein